MTLDEHFEEHPLGDLSVPRRDSLWVDNDPRNIRARYLKVIAGPDADGRMHCRSWWDNSVGVTTARLVKIQLKRFQPTQTDGWPMSGYRPADAPPTYGAPA